MPTVLALVHSPLVGPITWSLVAEELKRRHVETVVPVLVDDDRRQAPYWQQHVDAVTRALVPILRDRALVLVGHSGAGALLPAIADATDQTVAAYLFVDAGIPTDGLSRLEAMAIEDPEFARELEQHLAAGGDFPEWSEEDLEPLVPDQQLRHQLVSELYPRSFAFFTEPIPVFVGWPDAPCGYLKFSAAYDAPAIRAREAGWRCLDLPAGHFHMLVDPVAVAAALLDLLDP